LCSFRDRLMWMLRIASRVAFIALFEPGHRFSGRYDRLVSVSRIAGVGKLVVANYTKQGQEEWKVCLCHDVLSFLFVFKMIGWSGKWLNEKQAQPRLRQAQAAAGFGTVSKACPECSRMESISNTRRRGALGRVTGPLSWLSYQ